MCSFKNTLKRSKLTDQNNHRKFYSFKLYFFSITFSLDFGFIVIKSNIIFSKIHFYVMIRARLELEFRGGLG